MYSAMLHLSSHCFQNSILILKEIMDILNKVGGIMYEIWMWVQDNTEKTE